MYLKNGFKLEACPRMPPFKWDTSQAPKMFIAREIMYKSRQYQISRNLIAHYFKLLKSDIVLFLHRLPDIMQKCFCTPNEAMDPTFHMKYVPVF